jgi:hypothetical protein
MQCNLLICVKPASTFGNGGIADPGRFDTERRLQIKAQPSGKTTVQSRRSTITLALAGTSEEAQLDRVGAEHPDVARSRARSRYDAPTA